MQFNQLIMLAIAITTAYAEGEPTPHPTPVDKVLAEPESEADSAPASLFYEFTIDPKQHPILGAERLDENGRSSEPDTFDGTITKIGMPHEQTPDAGKENANVVPVMMNQVKVGDKLSSVRAKVEENVQQDKENRPKNRPTRAAVGTAIRCGEMSRSTKYPGWICKFGGLAWQNYTGRMRVWLNEESFGTVMNGETMVTDSVAFQGNVIRIATFLKRLNGWGGRFYRDGNMLIGIKTYDPAWERTVATKEELQETLRKCIGVANDKSAVSYCCRVDDSTKWKADIRIMRDDIEGDLWSIRCEY